MRWPLAILFAAALGGCAGVSSQRDPAPPASADLARQHAAAVAAMRHWRLNGRMAIQHDDQGFSASLEWRERDGVFDLRVAAPLGRGTVAMSGDATQVMLTTAKGEHFVAASAESLMQAHLGWSLPVGGVRYWVKGMPAPQTPPAQEVYDRQGRWTDFAQDGWRISILDYDDNTGLSLPRKLFLSRDDLQVRLVIGSWRRN